MIKLLRFLPVIKNKPRLFFRLAGAFFKANVLGKDLLRGVELAVTYQCQADCRKCSCKDLIAHERRQMSIDEIVRIATQVVDAGGILINLTGGEPLLRDDIVAIVRALNRLPVIRSLTTNGLLLDEAMLKSLKGAGLDLLQISLNSPFAEEHDKEIGIQGSYRKTLRAINEAKRQNLSVFINTVVTKKILYSPRLEKLASFAKKHKCFLSLILPAKVGKWEEEDVYLNVQDYAMVKNWLRFDFITIDTETSYKRGRCPAGTEKIYISPYGDLYPCPFIHKNFGNVLEHGFFRLWKEMRSQTYRRCVNLETQ